MQELTYETLPAPPPLDRVVHCFWFLRGRGDGSVQTIVPDGRAEIVVHVGEPWASQESVVLSGQLTGPLALRSSQQIDVVGIRLRPDAPHALLGIAQDELTNAVVPLRVVANRLARALEQAARSAPTSDARMRALSGPLAELAPREPSPVAQAVARAAETLQTFDLHRMARSLGVTTRTLERRCRTEIGVPAGTLRRLVRFRRAYRRLERTPVGQWARIAVASGYYDQAHMNRDFREFAGASPSVFFGREPELASAFLSDH